MFEGPLELLLALAEREEVDIFQVSLARVTDAYLAEIAQRETPDPQEMAEFLWMAARLLLLKSIRLLPGETPNEEETELLGWEEDVRQRLEEYRAYKAMAQELMERAEQETFAFPPPPRPPEPLCVLPMSRTRAAMLLPTELDLVALRSKARERARIVDRYQYELGELLAISRAISSERDVVRLLGLILESEDRLEAVVTFVAVLELLRRSVISVRQKERFGPIHIEARSA